MKTNSTLPKTDRPPNSESPNRILINKKKGYWRLKKSNDELKRLSEAKSSFVSLVSHEIRTPLNVIKDSTEILLEEIDGPLTLEQAKTLQLTRMNINRLNRLIENLLGFNGLKTGKLTSFLSRVDVKRLVQEVCSFMKPAVEKEGLTLRWETPDGAIFLACDSDQIRQVLTNLLDNAIKYNRTRGSVEVKLTRKKRFVQILVKDTGIGIPLKDQKRIFGMYEQVTSKGSTEGGVGLGLAISRQIVMNHRGELLVNSAPGRGSRFSIRIPCPYEEKLCAEE